jgi:hypothetical protein
MADGKDRVICQGKGHLPVRVRVVGQVIHQGEGLYITVRVIYHSSGRGLFIRVRVNYQGQG